MGAKLGVQTIYQVPLEYFGRGGRGKGLAEGPIGDMIILLGFKPATFEPQALSFNTPVNTLMK